MRRWLLLSLVLLLSLRGLVGDAMAGQMLSAHMAAAAAAASQVLPAAVTASASPDCDSHGAGHAMPAQPAQPGEAQAEVPADCPTCASCQVCSSVALSPTPATAPALPPACQQPQQASASYPSAESALAFKPPRG